MDWIIENWDLVLQLLAALLMLLGVLAKLTVTTKDDEVISLLQKIVSALNVKTSKKQKSKLP